jgi:hypothetical protein
MYIDKYDVTVSGAKYNHKTKKSEKDIDLVHLASDEGLQAKAFMSLLDELKEAHNGCDVEVSVVIKQHQYGE